jgi:hypothetical protein
MKHFATPDFWFHYRLLPQTIHDLAGKNFSLLTENPRHPSLRLKKAGEFWSVRVGLGHRALGKNREEGIVWFWIGTHAEYDQILS